MYYLKRSCFIALIFYSLLIDSIMSQLTMETPSVTASIGDTVILSAKSSTVLSTSLVNWYAGGVAITSNGVLSGSPTKYNVFNNGTLFRLTIYSVASTDFTAYTLLYLNVPTAFSSVNATITQYTITTTSSYVACDTTSTTTATFCLQIIGYILLLITNSLMFTLARSQRNKVECRDITIFVLFLQISTALMVVLVVIWFTSFNITQYANYLISSIFGLAAYLISWIGILYFLIIIIKEENMSLIIVFTFVGILVFQVGMYLGVILCVTHCGYTTILPTITLDYGRLGIIFSTFLCGTCLFIMFWVAIFLRHKDLRDSLISVSRRGREVLLSPGSLMSGLDNATRASIVGKGSKIVPVPSNAGVSSLPPQPSNFEKLVIKLPKPIQQFIRSIQRKFKKDNDDEFKSLVTPDTKAIDQKGKKTDLKGSKLNGGPKITPRQSTVDNIKLDKSKQDKNKGSKDNKKDTASQAGKNQIADNTKQVQAQQKQQANVDSKTQNLSINPKQPTKTDTKENSKDGKDAKRKKDSTPVQAQPVIQVPGTVPPAEPQKKEKEKEKKKDKKSKKKGKSKKRRSDDEDEDENEYDSNDDITEVDEDDDRDNEDNDSENDDEQQNDSEKETDDEDEDITEPNDSIDEDNDSEVEKKKKKGKKSNSKQSKSKKKKK